MRPGGLGAGEMTREARSLLERTSPDEALELFLELNIDRVRGNLPPYAGLAADLRRLIRAAGADQGEVETRLLTALLPLPATSWAPAGFWEAYEQRLVTMGEDAQVRRALLGLAPAHLDSDAWIGLLEDAGAVQDLCDGLVDTRSWVQGQVNLVVLGERGYPRRLSQVIRSLKGLDTLTLVLTRRYDASRLEPELLDALLDAGADVFLDGPAGDAELSLDHWAAQDEPSDLSALAASGHVHRLDSSIKALAANRLGALTSRPGALRILRVWATPRLSDRSTFPDVVKEVERLRPLRTPRGLQAVPDQIAALDAWVDGPALLAESLRRGLLTELTWLALEAAATRMEAEATERDAGGQDAGGQDRPKVTFHAAWPAVGVACNGSVTWVNGEEEVATATFTPPDATRPEDWRYTLVGSVTGCMFYRTVGAYHDRYLTWSHEPDVVHPLSSDSAGVTDDDSAEVPEGRLTGTGLQRAGTGQLTYGGLLMQEANRYWTLRQGRLVRISPVTGRTCLARPPRRLTALVGSYLRRNYTLQTRVSVWTPTTPTTADSLMNTAKGVHAWVVLRRGDEERVLGADSQVLDVRNSGEEWKASGRLERPGGGYWLRRSWPGGDLCDDALVPLVRACDARGREHMLHRLPYWGWYQLRVRDKAASVRMRTLTPRDVSTLLEVAPAAGRPDQAAFMPSARHAARALLGSDQAALVDSVVWLAAQVKQLMTDVARLQAAQTKGTFDAWGPGDQVYSWLTGQIHYQPLPRDTALELGECLRNREPRYFDPQRWLLLPSVRPEVVLACAASPLRPVKEVYAAAATVGTVIDAGLCVPGALAYSFEAAGPVSQRLRCGSLVEGDPPGLVLDRVGRTVQVLSTGVPVQVRGRQTTLFLGPSSVPSGEVVEAFRLLLRDGPAAWERGRAEALAQATGWSYGAAALFLTGMRDLYAWERDFLPGELRELLGLKVAEAEAARTFLCSLDLRLLVDMYGAGAADPVRVVRQGLDVQAAAQVWCAAQDPHDLLSPELLMEADNVCPFGADGLRHLYDADLEDHGTLLEVMVWLASRLERDHPARPWLADRFEEYKKGLWGRPVSFTTRSRGRVHVTLGLPPAPEAVPGVPHTQGAWTLTPGKEHDEVTWTPSLVTSWEAERELLSAVHSYDTKDVERAVLVLGGGLDALFAGLRVPGRGVDQDPLVSAPRTVAEVVCELGLGVDSARYWLQLLTLYDPTDRNIASWNGWGRAERMAAAGPLLERGLVVQVRRVRAERSYFLPGDWVEDVIPGLFTESWKPRQSYYPRFSFRVPVPLEPLGQLFAAAWGRYRSGDRPRGTGHA